jgi:uncharacterized membrane protein YsdA (DUF1294 family)
MATKGKGRPRRSRRRTGSKAVAASGIIAALMALAVFALVLGIYARHNRLLPYLAGVYAVPSVLVFGLYGWDKRVAVRGGSRTSEQSLHLLALAGGWPGAMLARSLFRHKTRKQPFTGIFWCTVLFNVGTVSVLLGEVG